VTIHPALVVLIAYAVLLLVGVLVWIRKTA
jgi:hypothetical protein